MPAESYGSGEATGLRRKWLIAVVVIDLATVILALGTGHLSLSAGAAAIGVAGAVRYLSIRGKGVDPSKSAIQRVREGDTRKYGRPF
jgi:hypothetical protein